MGTRDICEVAVVGGGPAGAMAALTMARLGCRAWLIEASHYDEPRLGETLPPSVEPLLARIGPWEAFASSHAVASYGNQSAWGGPDLLGQSFIFSPQGNGWHVDRRRFDSMLVEAAASAGATVLAGRQVVACISMSGGTWRLTLRSAGDRTKELTARGVIDATGRRAALARWLGAKRRIYDHLVGVAALYRGPERDGGYTLVEATRAGWWYSAPVPPDKMMVMFMTDADLCKLTRCADPEIWDAQLARAEQTQRRVDRHQRLWKPRISSAVTHRLVRACHGRRWLAVGDAATGVDPLSSSGVLQAMLTGQAAGEAMAYWINGTLQPAKDYDERVDLNFKDYWVKRSAFYSAERRWSDAPFWRRRGLLPLNLGPQA
jgi:flavin-dependent dehydrogenase